jgi:hypothetical protein
MERIHFVGECTRPHIIGKTFGIISAEMDGRY